MARELRICCDFCGKDITKTGFATVSGKITGARDGDIPHALVQVNKSFPEGNNPDLCLDCYNGMLRAIAPFANYINTKGGRKKQEQEEAAHE